MIRLGRRRPAIHASICPVVLVCFIYGHLVLEGKTYGCPPV